MLTQLRLKSQNFMIFILFGMLIFVFIFFFGPQSQGFQPGGSQGATTGIAAKVGGVEIPASHVEIAVRRQGDVDAEQLPAVRREALEQIVEQELLAQKAQAAGIALSDDELSAYIVSKDNRDFVFFANRDGKFDIARYESYVTQGFGASTAAYRDVKRRELLAERYIGFLEQQVQVSEAEIRAAFERAKRTWKLSYVIFDPQEWKATVPAATAEEGQAWAAAHADEVKAYYDENKKEFDHGKEIRVYRVLVRAAADAAEEQKAAAKKKAEELHAKATAPGADFEQIAREGSEGYYAKFGGDMGWQSEDNTSKSDFAVYSQLEKGQVSAVQSTSIGFWFVKAADIKPAVKKSLDEVRDEIGARLATTEKQAAAAKQAGDAALARLKAGESLDQVFPGEAQEPAPAQEAPKGEGEDGAEGEPEAVPAPAAAPKAPALKVQTTPPFSEDRPVFARIPGVGKSEALAAKLPELTAENALVPELMALEDGKLAIVRLEERVEPKDEEFAAERAQFERRLRGMRLVQLFGNWRAAVFGPPTQRALMKRFAGGALLAALQADAGKVKFNESLYPAPAPAAPESAAP
ncbi:MAG: SurA N-terminal domain-containing protein [Myxococcales bacterium]|nr:SurA N-terminal domain-containing protein [Myxococcales bacterium]MCB9524871.1 SurA N-terminal domain-containing protein [Myxococcales bacterium]